MLRLLGAIGASLLCTRVLGQEPASSAAPVKAVLVTGASTGIGRKITERLAADGYFVYAGARKEADLKALGALKNVQAVRLDVTNTAGCRGGGARRSPRPGAASTGSSTMPASPR